MIEDFTIYCPDTGKIMASGRSQNPSSLLDLYETPSAIISEAGDHIIEYVHDGHIAVRPKFQTVVSGTTITTVPHGTKVYIDNEYAGECKSGSITINKEHPSDLCTVRLELFPYIDTEFEL